MYSQDEALNHLPYHRAKPEVGQKFAIMPGSWMTEMAKISGMTPEEFTFIGMWVLWPPYILRPTMRLAYCTGTRRTPLSTNTMPTIISSTPTITSGMNHAVTGLAITDWMPVKTSPGKLAMIPTKISSDTPLPMPFSVMRSPIHMVKAVPAASTTKTRA